MILDLFSSCRVQDEIKVYLQLSYHDTNIADAYSSTKEPYGQSLFTLIWTCRAEILLRVSL